MIIWIWHPLYLLSSFPDRPWLTDVQKIQKLQEKVYVALQRCLQKEGASDEKLAKVTSAILKEILTCYT